MLTQFKPFQLHLAPCTGFYELINCVQWQDSQLDPTHAIKYSIVYKNIYIKSVNLILLEFWDFIYLLLLNDRNLDFDI